MTVTELANALSLEILAGGEQVSREVEGCYIGDLLSRVISRAAPGGAWVTIMTNVNGAAVALLADVACIILAEGCVPDPQLLEKCESEAIPLLSSPRSAYDLAASMHDLGV